MKFSRSDFLLMRWSIAAICASSLIGATVLYSSSEYVDEAQKQQRNARNRLKDANNRLTTAQQDRENMAIYADEYRSLIENRIIGNDRRLDWMEGLEDIRKQNLVTDFRYSIAPQKIHTPQPPLNTGSFDLHYSAMKLELDLLHEGQLLDFFDALRSRIKGWYQLEGCTLQRTGTGNEAQPTATARLKADCSGGWITLKNRNAPQ